MKARKTKAKDSSLCRIWKRLRRIHGPSSFTGRTRNPKIRHIPQSVIKSDIPRPLLLDWNLCRHSVSTRSPIPPQPRTWASTVNGPWHKEFLSMMIFAKQSTQEHINNRFHRRSSRFWIPFLISLPDKLSNLGVEATHLKVLVDKRSQPQKEENSASHEPHQWVDWTARSPGKSISRAWCLPIRPSLNTDCFEVMQGIRDAVYRLLWCLLVELI